MSSSEATNILMTFQVAGFEYKCPCSASNTVSKIPAVLKCTTCGKRLTVHSVDGITAHISVAYHGEISTTKISLSREEIKDALNDGEDHKEGNKNE